MPPNWHLPCTAPQAGGANHAVLFRQQGDCHLCGAINPEPLVGAIYRRAETVSAETSRRERGMSVFAIPSSVERTFQEFAREHHPLPPGPAPHPAPPQSQDTTYTERPRSQESLARQISRRVNPRVNPAIAQRNESIRRQARKPTPMNHAGAGAYSRGIIEAGNLKPASRGANLIPAASVDSFRLIITGKIVWSLYYNGKGPDGEQMFEDRVEPVGPWYATLEETTLTPVDDEQESPLLEHILNFVKIHDLESITKNDSVIRAFLAPIWQPRHENGFIVGIPQLGEGQESGIPLSRALRNFKYNGRKPNGEYEVIVVFVRHDEKRAKELLETPKIRKKGKTVDSSEFKKPAHRARARTIRAGTLDPFLSSAQKPVQSIEEPEQIDLISDSERESSIFQCTQTTPPRLTPRESEDLPELGMPIRPNRSPQHEPQVVKRGIDRALVPDDEAQTPTPSSRIMIQGNKLLIKPALPAPSGSLQPSKSSSLHTGSRPTTPQDSPAKRNRPTESPEAGSPGAARNAAKAAEQRARGRKDQEQVDIQGGGEEGDEKDKSKGTKKGKRMGTSIPAGTNLRRSKRGQLDPIVEGQDPADTIAGS